MTTEPDKLEPIEDHAEVSEESSVTPVEAPTDDEVESAEADTVEPPFEPVLNTDVLYTNALPVEEKKAPALTINIASWATPIVGLVMLLFGLTGGYFLRPMVTASPTETPAPTADTAAAPQQQQQQQPQQANQPTDAEREALMAALLPQVRHFKGDPNAPITLIEFSDFQ